MAKLIYRVVSACGALGYGFPRESLQKALTGRIDAVISDAGSMDAGPYYLGTGSQYFERDAVKNDFRKMVEAGDRIEGPVILGSCGMAGGDRNLDGMLAAVQAGVGEGFLPLGGADELPAIFFTQAIEPAILLTASIVSSAETPLAAAGEAVRDFIAAFVKKHLAEHPVFGVESAVE